MIKGVVFDFNGTLFWDSQLHMDAWKKFSEKLRGTPFSDEEMLVHIFGRTNSYIIEYALKHKPSAKLVAQYTQEKEQYYRNMCLKHKDMFKLADGAIEFFDFLKSKNIPMAIATMSEWSNVEFYIKEFNLTKWFNIENIVYSDGTIKGKPAPDIFNIAIRRLNIKPEHCLIIEDAISGLQAAKAADAGKIIAIASREPEEYYKNLDYVELIIKNFDEVDRNIFQ